LLFLLVHFYLKWVFFGPMRDVLAKRRAATEGFREAAEAMRARAQEETAAIEAQLRAAREQIYQEQEEARRRWLSEQGEQLESARTQSRDLIHQSKSRLDAEAEEAKKQLGATADALAEEITNTLLERSAA
jgi:F-type H+-transporting ATPase subunit b